MIKEEQLWIYLSVYQGASSDISTPADRVYIC